jgi:hypothetical protein
VARRQLLTEDERRLLFGVPQEADALTRHYSFTRSDQALLAERRGDANRLGFAVQLSLLRHPGIASARSTNRLHVQSYMTRPRGHSSYSDQTGAAGSPAPRRLCGPRCASSVQYSAWPV